jgi:bisphosphoglycerate-independent phosphoglycerate mutase (AlkP superfamily)
MTTTETTAGRSYAIARQRRLQRVLETYGVLTTERLRELSGAESWHVPIELTLKRALAAERVRRLSADLYEAGPGR